MKRRQSVESTPVGAPVEMALSLTKAVEDETTTTTVENKGPAIIIAKRKPPPSLPYLVALNSLICGIEFSASAGYAYIPPLMQKCGLSKSVSTCLMGIGPYMALGAIPILGRWSDRCQFRFGRRWPFIFAISLLSLLSLMFMLVGASMSSDASTKTLAIVLTSIGVILLDLSCLIGFNPCEALVSDAVLDTDCAKHGFMVYSCMLSLGGCVGYLITATDWSDTVLGRIFKIQEQMAFSVVIVLMFVATTTTLCAAAVKHVTTADAVNRPLAYVKLKKTLVDCLDNNDGGYETGSNDSLRDEMAAAASRGNGVLKSSSSYAPLLPPPPNRKLPSQTSSSLFAGNKPNATSVVFLCYYFTQKTCTLLRRTASSVRTMLLSMLLVPIYVASLPIQTIKHVYVVPLVLRRLFFADLCGWASLLCYYMFYTDYVAQSVYGGDPNAQENSRGRALYDAGVRMGSFGLLLHSITSCFYAAFLQDVIISRYGMACAYIFGLGTFGLCMFGILVTSNINVINIITAVAGLGFTAITTIPNTLVTGYQADKELYFFDAKKKSDGANNNPDALIEHGTGEDFAVIDSAYILAQIMVSVAMGPLADLTRSVKVYIVNSMIFAFLACYCVSRVIFTATSAKRLHDSKV